MAIFHHPNGHLPHLFLILFIIPAVSAIRADVATEKTSYNNPSDALLFHEAPAFRNADYCNVSFSGIDGAMDDYGRRVHIAMTLDANYLRGTMAAVHSILQHTACPDNLTFHFLAARYETAILATITYSFPYLDFVVHRFDQDRVRGRISRSIRKALDQPLNYARIYLAHILPPEVDRVIYLDSDVIVVDDITSLWKVDLEGNIVAAPEYCHANFTKYFTDAFWKKPKLSRTFQNRRACYFNTGVMVMDVNRWRVDGYTRKMEEWMGVQKKERIYILGSLPPFLLVAAGNIKAVDHKWNQHGLGGDNIEGKCRKLHPGPISLLHWSGKGKPWLRLDSRKPCSVDRLWAPYDPFRIQSSIIPWVL